MGQFTVLPESLHTTAKGTISYFKSSYGLQKVLIEEPIKDFETLSLRPSIQGKSKTDGSRFCIEVVEKLRIPPSVNKVLEECRGNSPIKFILVIPSGAEHGDPEFAKNLRDCRLKGVGVYTVNEDGDGEQLQGPLSQLAAAVRKIEVSDYPKAFRASLQIQMETYSNGNPAASVQGLASMLEDLTRKVMSKAVSKGLMTTNPSYSIATHSWAILCEDLRDGLIRKKSGVSTVCEPITVRLMSRIHGFTEYRNAFSHIPRSLKELKDREQNVRSYFEQASVLLSELIVASKKLKV